MEEVFSLTVPEYFINATFRFFLKLFEAPDKFKRERKFVPNNGSIGGKSVFEK